MQVQLHYILDPLTGHPSSCKFRLAVYNYRLAHSCHRSVVKPTDIVRFDEKISPHELRTFCESFSQDDSDDSFELTMDTKEGR